mmetsp:Transcript_3573/g.6733  ORF Transcript_3573/g.6733 Transcript_3573/m.6733 type:complete len:456 (-) Transcript_3573:43-1410(-)
MHLPLTTAGLALYTCIYSSEDTVGSLSPCPDASSSSTWSLAVDTTKPLQSIDGFGAAWTDATTYLFDSLDEELVDGLMLDLFTSSGIQLEFMRTTIGQSDLTPDGRWSFDENGGEPDPELAGWSLTEPGERMLRYVKRMCAISPDVTLLGSIWSPPGWMKENNTLISKYIQAYVNYIVSYLNEYKSSGVEVTAITLQNEPLHSAPVSGEAWTMFMNASYAALLTNATYAAMAANKLGTEIWAYDHNTDKPAYPQHVLDNTEVSTVAWHCYASASGGFEALQDFARANFGVKQYMTECWLHDQSGEGFFDLPQFIMRPVQFGASGALVWTLAGSVDLDVSYPGGCRECTGIVQVDMKAGTFEKNHDWYTLGQFSKFVRKGARYVNVEGDHIYEDNTGVESAGFINPDGSVILIVMNKFSNTLEVTVNVDGVDVVQVLAARSLTTLVLGREGKVMKN